MRFVTASLFVLAAIAAHAQLPDTVQISARNVAPVYSHVVLRQGTKYVLEISGRLSYWRSTADVNVPDADAGFVFHVPYVPYALSQEVDSANFDIGQFQYLPADGSQCSTVPTEFGCGTISNSHSTNIRYRQELHLDKDYLEFNGQEFCPRNGGDKQNNTYWQGLMGDGQRAKFQIHDGDDDTTNNWGVLTATIARLEPVYDVARRAIDFGTVVKSHPVAVVRTDSVFNRGGPFFPGCNAAAANLQYTVVQCSGDTGANGFRLIAPVIGNVVNLPQGYASAITAQFLPAESRAYRAVISLTTNDVQQLQDSIVLTGNGSGFVSVDDPNASLPSAFAMDIAPNPMSARATLRLMRGASIGEHVSIVLYDLLGRAVRTIYDGAMDQPAMDAEMDASGLAPGMYWCEAVASRGSRVGKFVEVR